MMALCITAALITGRTIDTYKSRYATAGFTNHPAVASCYLLSTLPVFLRLLPQGAVAIGALAILFTSLFFTMRRCSLIAAAVATGCCLLLYLIAFRARIPWRKTLAILGVLTALAGIAIGTSAGDDWVKQFKDLNPLEGTGSGRYTFWQISLEHVTDRPIHARLLGEGMGSIRDVLKRRFGLAIGSHNDWLDLVNAFGVCGLMGIAWGYWELTRLAGSLRNHRDGLFQGACAVAIILGLMSMGTGGVLDPAWAISYAAMGFWAGRAVRVKECHSVVD